jgi:membrane glycosyltransferase
VLLEQLPGPLVELFSVFASLQLSPVLSALEQLLVSPPVVLLVLAVTSGERARMSKFLAIPEFSLL